MAEYGIVMKIDTIKGNVQLADYADNIGVQAMSMVGSAMRSGTGVGAKDSVSVRVSQVAVTISAGKWTAELLNACYNLTNLGKVVLTQIAQSVDNTATAKPTVIQTITLDDCTIASCSQAMEGGGGDRMASLTLEFSHITHAIDSKSADFQTRNINTKAI